MFQRKNAIRSKYKFLTKSAHKFQRKVVNKFPSKFLFRYQKKTATKFQRNIAKMSQSMERLSLFLERFKRRYVDMDMEVALVVVMATEVALEVADITVKHKV